jgi:integrase/recombinase XerC
MTMKIITADQEEKLFKYLKDSKWKLIYSLMVHAGLRVGEVVMLKWSDFFDNSLPRIRLIVRPEITKTKSQRIIPLHVKTQNLLLAYVLIKASDYKADENAFMFQNKGCDNHISIRHIQRMLTIQSSIAFGECIHPHTLRHTYATNLMKICNIRIVQELLGHKSLQSTQVYTHPNINDLDKAVGKL